MPNANYNEMLTTSLANHRDKLVDNVFTSRPLFHFLKQADQIRMVNGGHKIVLPLMIGVNTSVAAFADDDQVDTHEGLAGDDYVTAAEYPWRQLSAGIRVNNIDQAKNNGEQEIIDLVESRLMVTENSISEYLDEVLIAGGTATDFLGLDDLVAQNATPVGGIDPSTNTYWQSYINSTAEALTIGAMSTAYNTAAEGADQANFGLTTQTLFETYEALLQPQLRFTDSKTADAGFQNLLFKGAPLCYDTYVPAGQMFFLNTKYLRLVGHKDHWFRTTPFVTPHDYDFSEAHIFLYGQFTVTNRSRQAVLTAKTA